MGTHPIFESDFDCLTENNMSFDLLEGETKRERKEVAIDCGEWPTNGAFTVAEGLIAIKHFVAKWQLDEQWLFCIDHIDTIEQEFAIEHKYNVRFSIPTRKKPIPTATASVFFTLTQSTVTGSDAEPMSIAYQVEGFRLSQSPGAFTFRQQWLYEVL